MKLNKIFAAFMLIIAVAFAACETPEPPVGPNGPGNGTQDSTTVEDTTQTQTPTELVIPEEAKAWNIPAEAIDVLKAREICAALESGATTGTKYYVMGYVKKIHSKHADGVANFGNAQFYMENVKGANSHDDFMAYQVYGPNGKKITDPAVVAEGDFVVVYGELTNYNGTYETVGKGAAYIWNSTNPLLADNSGNNQGGNEGDITYEDGEISVAAALEMGANLASGDTTDYIKVRGKVKYVKTVSLSYGNAQFYITDDGNNELYCYNIKGVDGEKFVSGEQLVEGDIVTVEARLYNYASADGDLLELIKGNLTRTTNTFDPSQATGPKEVTVAEAFAEGSLLGQGETSSGQYKVTGVITEVTEASTSYGNLTFKIKDENGTQEMICYRLYYLENKKYTEDDPALETGDIVTIIAQIKNHYGEIEFVSGYLTEHIK
jgi:hypothetical protein